MMWNAVIFGPTDTPFEDGTFKLVMEFSEDYPNKPPVVRFVSKMFHPNGAPALLPARPCGVGLMQRAVAQCMLMAGSAWTFCRTAGARPTMLRPF